MTKFRLTLMAAMAAVGVLAAGGPLGLFSLGGDGEALAQQGNGPQGGQGAGGGAGGQGMGGAGGQGLGGGGGGSIEEVLRGGGRRVIIILEEDGDEDSDRPEWAQGNRELNPHARGGGQPAGAGSKKGDLYGDLYVLLRDANGEPVLDDNGNLILIGSDGSLIYLTEDGEVPEDKLTLVQEVEFSRLSVARSPTQVTDHALDEVLTKLAAATTITVDSAGRLVLDGVAIDSPLENLAFYEYLMTGGTLPDGVTLPADFDVASLLGAASDKTGEITVDVLVYMNTILGINTIDINGVIDYYDFSTYDYDRTATYADATVTYLADTNGDGLYEVVTEPVMDAVFDGIDWTDPTADGGADDFAQAADDARAVIEFVHEMPTPTL